MAALFARSGGEDGSAPAVLLTDKYPNPRAFQQIQDATGSVINFYPEPVDAMRIPPELAGFRTMFSTFHHFGPGEARAILKDAFDQRQGIAVFEAAKCDFRTLAAVFCRAPAGLAACATHPALPVGADLLDLLPPGDPVYAVAGRAALVPAVVLAGGYAGAGRRDDP